MSNLKYVTDDEEFNALMKTVGNEIVVVDFYTTWCGPCRHMEPVVQSMVMKYPSVWFLKVDADSCFETAMNHGVKGVPLFVIYMNQVVVDRVEGAHPQDLDNKVAKYEHELRTLKAAAANANAMNNERLDAQQDQMNSLSHVISTIGKIQDLTPYMDLKGCRCINDLTPTSFDSFLHGKKLVSGKGSGKLVLIYSFTEKLMLHSFRIKAHADSGPKVLRLFANHPKMLDFQVGTQLAPSQEVTLSPDDLNGEKAIELRTGSFSLVSNLQIFITEGMSKGHHKIEIESLSIFGAPVELSKPSLGFEPSFSSSTKNSDKLVAAKAVARIDTDVDKASDKQHDEALQAKPIEKSVVDDSSMTLGNDKATTAAYVRHSHTHSTDKHEKEDGKPRGKKNVHHKSK